MADMMEEAFADEWIDFYPRKGKVGGAFCENLPFLKQSRVLTNFDGSLGDVVTLAHELGHAYHGMICLLYTSHGGMYLPKIKLPIEPIASDSTTMYRSLN